MRKLWVAWPVALLVLTLTAIAVAQEPVTNTYDVEGSTSPARAGSRTNPVPIAINFNYEIGEVQNRRPGVIKKYSIRFGGTGVNTNVAANCPKSVLEANRSVDNCPARSIAGNGVMESILGPENDPSGPSIDCSMRLWIVNQGNRKANIFVKGDPDTPRDSPEHCPIRLEALIPA